MEEALEVLPNRQMELACEEEKDKVAKEAEELCEFAWEPVDGLGAAAHAETLVSLSSHMDECFDLDARIAEMLSRKNQYTGIDVDAVCCSNKGA